MSTTLKKKHLIDSILQHTDSPIGEDYRAFLNHYLPSNLTASFDFDAKWWAHTTEVHWQMAQEMSKAKHTMHILIETHPEPADKRSASSRNHTLLICCADIAFLFNSILCMMKQQGVRLHTSIHPIVPISTWMPAASEPNRKVSMIRAEFSVGVKQSLAELKNHIQSLITDIQRINQDYQPMLQRCEALSARLYEADHPTRAFLDWISRSGFAFFGYAEVKTSTQSKLRLLKAQGVLKRDHSTLQPWSGAIPSQIINHLEISEHGSIALTKSTQSYLIQRNAPLDIISLVDKNTATVHLIVGQFTESIYHYSLNQIPLLNSKLDLLLAHSSHGYNSYSWLELTNIIHQLPRDWLMMLPQQEIEELALKHLKIQENPQAAIHIWREPFRRFFWVLLLVPEDAQLNAAQKRVITRALYDNLAAQSVEYQRHNGHRGIQLHSYTVFCDDESEPLLDKSILATIILEHAASWTHQLSKHLTEQFSRQRAEYLIEKFAHIFPLRYQNANSAQVACKDIVHLDDPSRTLQLYASLLPKSEHQRLQIRICCQRQSEPSLHTLLYTLRDFGMEMISESTYELELEDPLVIKVIEVHLPETATTEHFLHIQTPLLDCIAQTLSGRYESDQLNRLVLLAQIHPRSISVLRAYCKLLQQLRSPFSQAGVIGCIIANAPIAQALIQYFEARFHPNEHDDARARQCKQSIQDMLKDVSNLDHDRIIRRFENFIHATVRCNYYQTEEDGSPKPWLAFKICSGELRNIPSPKPLFEIFVYAPHFEGIHLRSDPISRGGLRWSDRRDDFRTEVLGLVKAQIVKNSVAVPGGSKGGFFVKTLDHIAANDHTAIAEEVQRCYRDFISAMLDLTDNIVDDAIVSPPKVVRYDGDDPYLVVAADKGTASFSDLANQVAEEKNFWLGDAFASGGSNGYDHKKIGITSRGAWESARRHFRELDLNVDQDPIRVVAIGDMSGDVFGNGMLRSKHLLLIAAFNHKHIFIDPNPDPKISYKERLRLFKNPSLGWNDYNAKLLSQGGAVYSRKEKNIRLHSNACKALDINQSELTPDQLIKNILMAPVDMLWNGGIGTYVRAAHETDAEVRDRANDPVRVEGRRLRCRVAIEGGNLGFTQPARIEYARHGGLCFNDAADNVAGVVCSDHEVNLKILLRLAAEKKVIKSQQIPALMERLEPEVADRVLSYNRQQCTAISRTCKSKINILDEQSAFMDHLERIDQLNREEMNLPDAKAIQSLKTNQLTLTRPEISVLHAHAKIWLKNELLKEDLESEPLLCEIGLDYLPSKLSAAIKKQFSHHRLHQEMVTTFLVNRLVDCMGASFPYWCSALTHASPLQVCKAFYLSYIAFDIQTMWQTCIDSDTLPEVVRHELFEHMILFMRRSILWLLWQRFDIYDLGAQIATVRAATQRIANDFNQSLGALNRQEVRKNRLFFIKNGASETLATQVSKLVPLSSALDIFTCSEELGTSLELTAGVYYAVGMRLELQAARNLISALRRQNLWEHKAFWMLRQDILREQKQLTHDILKNYGNLSSAQPQSAASIIRRWISDNRSQYVRFSAIMADFKREKTNFTNVAVLIHELKTTFNLSA